MKISTGCKESGYLNGDKKSVNYQHDRNMNMQGTDKNTKENKKIHKDKGIADQKLSAK